MENTVMTMPVIALRGLSVLPGMSVSFDLSRVKSIAAVEKAMISDQRVALFTQRDPEDQDPDISQMYHIGTIAQVKQLVKMPGGVVRLMTEGLVRAELLTFDSVEPALIGEVAEAPVSDQELEYVTSEAMIRVLKEKMEEYGRQHPKFAKEVLPALLRQSSLSQLMLQMASELPWDYTVRQEYLEAGDPVSQYEVIVTNLVNEIEISQIRREFQEKVKASIDQNQKEYILREQMKIIREELGEDSLSEADEYEAK